jgi:hypothetical protein
METDPFSDLFQVLGDAVQRLDTDAMRAGDEVARARMHALGNDLILLHNDLQRFADRMADLQMAGKPIGLEEARAGLALWRQLDALAARIKEQGARG